MGNSLKLGIMGGTFDPIHTGHLVVAEMARQQFSLNKVIFVPAGIPPHKISKELALPKDRFEMVRLAISDNPFFDVSQCEINKGKVTYTVETLSEFMSSYPEGTVLYFIIGADSLLELKDWRDPSKLFDLSIILVYGRSGSEKELAFEEAQSLKANYNARIEFVEGPVIDISSTMIREMIMNDMSVKYIVPDVVLEYIQRNSLYRENGK
jgi:nicotinate-nucleotide adenylyltransferase